MPNRHARRKGIALARKNKIQARTTPSKDAIFGWSVPVEIKAASTEPNARRKFTLNAYTGEPMRLYGYELPVVIDCASVDLSVQKIPALYDHSDYGNNIVGQIEAVRVEGASGMPPIVADGFFTPTADPEDRANWVMAKADAGFQWQASVGGFPGRLERVEAGQTVAVNGRTYAGPVYVSRNTTLREISFVILGADRRTSANLRARIVREESEMKFNEWLLAKGITNFDSLPHAVQTTLQASYADEHEDADAPLIVQAGGPSRTPTPTTPPPQRTDPIAEENARVAANRQRIAEIDRICAQYDNPETEIAEGAQKKKVVLSAHAIANNWDANRTELEALRASRGDGPAIIKASESACTAQAIEGAMVLRAGGKLDHKAYHSNQAVAMKLPGWMRAGINDANRNQVMEAAHRFSSYSAVDLCREALRLAGKQVPHNREEMIQAAFSGGSLTNIFTTNVNAMLLSTYMEASDTTLAWTSEEDVADFKTNERPRMVTMAGLTKLPRGGEAQHNERSDVGESYRIARYAGQFVIDEQDIIDDNLSALRDYPVAGGNAAARLRPDLVYSILLSNPTLSATTRALFNSTDGNALSSGALAAATLRTAVKTMLLFQENSVNLNLAPTHLIVPPSLKHLADELINSSMLLIAGTAGSVTERGSANALQADGLQRVSDSRLENGCIDPDSGATNSGSTTAWYLACAAAYTIVVAYLRGTGRAPRVRTGQLEKGKYGQWWDVSMDIGAKALDWRGMVRSVA